MDNLHNLKLLLNVTSTDDDDLYRLLLCNARAWILAYTGRAPEQWLADFDAAQLRIAVIDCNRLGAEGAASRREGGVNTAFSGGGEYPRGVTALLDRYRLIK